jgi:hypothetical protein
MPEQSIIVWDLETIPDLEAAPRMLDPPTPMVSGMRTPAWLCSSE